MGTETQAKRIFLEAFEAPAAEREALVERACAGDEQLKGRVRRLLAAHAEGSADALFESAGSMTARETVDGRPLGEVIVRPFSIGPYRVLRVLGEGGMGTVYEAEQEQPRRPVALKVMRSGLASPRALARFAMETEVLGRLEHPGIARIYDAGTTREGAGAQPYFAMELVRGRPLLKHASAFALSVRERMRLVARICQAADYAHRCGIIHRDLKPGNILVSEAGEPKILDFGVARLAEPEGAADGAARHTMTGELVGTVAYMSPEQVAATPGALDHRSDVYALGLIAYELVTGRLPYLLDGLSIFAAVDMIRQHEPRSARELNRDVDADLDTILLKALDKEPGRRYGSAQALAEDIERWLSHEAVLARPATQAYRLRKFARRNPFLVGGVAAVLAATTLGAIGTTLGMLRARDRARLAESERGYWKGALEELSRGGGGKGTTFDQVLAEAAPQIEAAFARWPDERARRHQEHGELFRIVADHEHALEQFEKALAALEEMSNPPSRARFEALMGAATAALELQDMVRAEEYFARAERVLPGSGGAAYAEHLAGRAAAAHDLGDYELAEHLLRAALQAQEGAAFASREDRVRARAIDTGSLARLLVDRGRVQEAGALAEQAVALWEEAGQSQSRGAAFAMLTLGYARQAAGRWEEAEAAYRGAVAMYTALDDGRGPMVAIASMDLGGLLSDRPGGEPGTGDFAPRWERAALGDLAHVEVISLRNRARLLWRAGRRDDAAVLFDEAVARAREIGGAAAPVWISHTLLARGLVLGEGGDWAGAVHPLREALGVRPDSVAARAALGRALLENGLGEEAEPLLRAVAAERARTVGDTDEGALPTAAARIELAACLAAHGRAAEAKELVAGLDRRVPERRADLAGRLAPVLVALEREGRRMRRAGGGAD